MKTYKMKCESCGGTLDVEKDVLFCPYCGEKSMIVYDDKVKIAKIKADAKKEIAKYEIDAEERHSKDDPKETALYIIFGLGMLFILYLMTK